jgi:hypothetical protein
MAGVYDGTIDNQKKKPPQSVGLFLGGFVR